MNNRQLGIMQGRIFPENKLKYNIFPSHWRNELILSKKNEKQFFTAQLKYKKRKIN